MTTTVLQRLDIALQQAHLSRHDLADAIGTSRQAIYALARREGATLKPAHMAKAARVLACDFYWLCTGEGGTYVPAAVSFSFLAQEAAKLIDKMGQKEQESAFAAIYRMSQGQWPTGFCVGLKAQTVE